MKVKQIQEIFNSMNGEDEVWVAYFTKDDVLSHFADMEITDEETGEAIDTEQFATNEAVKQVGAMLDDNDYLWERFNETVSDSTVTVLNDLVREMQIANKEDKEEQQLWDKEQ